MLSPIPLISNSAALLAVLTSTFTVFLLAILPSGSDRLSS
jgi:hypothetical protein